MNTETSAPTILTTPTAVVHLEYDNLTPKPGPDWTRFICLSDTHCQEFPVPPGDVLLHSGDLTHSGTLSEFEGAVRWLQSLPHQHKIIIAGNHDIPLHDQDGWYNANYHRWHRRGKQNTQRIREVLRDAHQMGVVYLQDERHEFQVTPDGKIWSIYGFPWSPYHRNWAFNYNRGPEAERLVSAIPMTDILLSHAPPFQVLDIGRGGERAGCKALAARINTLRPRLHAFGHIHEDHGAYVHEWTTANNTFRVDGGAKGRTVFVNAANKPAGPKSLLSNGRRLPFGTGTYSPVIVDLLDCSTDS